MATFADDREILTTKKSAKDSNEALPSKIRSRCIYNQMQIPANNNLYLDGTKNAYSNNTI